MNPGDTVPGFCGLGCGRRRIGDFRTRPRNDSAGWEIRVKVSWFAIRFQMNSTKVGDNLGESKGEQREGARCHEGESVHSVGNCEKPHFPDEGRFFQYFRTISLIVACCNYYTIPNCREDAHGTGFYRWKTRLANSNLAEQGDHWRGLCVRLGSRKRQQCEDSRHLNRSKFAAINCRRRRRSKFSVLLSPIFHVH